MPSRNPVGAPAAASSVLSGLLLRTDGRLTDGQELQDAQVMQPIAIPEMREVPRDPLDPSAGTRLEPVPQAKRRARSYVGSFRGRG